MNKLPNYLKISAFAKYIGMNESLLRQYNSGIVEPSEKQKEKIKEGLTRLGNELKSVKII